MRLPPALPGRKFRDEPLFKSTGNKGGGNPPYPQIPAVDAVKWAQSGHSRTPMETAALGLCSPNPAPMPNPANTGWTGRDRFVPSCEQASMLFQVIIHLCSYDLFLQEIKNFRQFVSKAPGHSGYGHTPGVETTTGSLDQGFGSAVGPGIHFFLVETLSK